MKKVSVIVGICVGIATLIGAYYTFDCTYSRASWTKKIELRLDKKILQDRLYYLQERIWKLEDRYGRENACELDEYRRLIRDKEEAERELNGLR